MSKLNLTIAQLNFNVGDIQGNLAKILESIEDAKKTQKPDLIVFPELALSGYPPEDLLLRDDFHAQIELALKILREKVRGVDILVGYPKRVGRKIYNAACLFSEGVILADCFKQKLPNYGVFDEKRYFEAGHNPCVIPYRGTFLGILICEDVWYSQPALKAREHGAQWIICINASPFDREKLSHREEILRQRVTETQLPIIYAHFVGGQDELLFDGCSMVMDAQQNITHRAPAFVETLLPVKIYCENNQVSVIPGEIAKDPAEAELLYLALTAALRDYVNKNNFPGVILGLSGGIDSALTLAIAVDALGADRVHTIAMPSRYTADMSTEDAHIMAKQLGVHGHLLSIENIYANYLELLAPEFKGHPENIAEENLQARIRGNLLMAFSNKFNLLVLTTGNKSEMAVGYATLYGDMAGGFAVIKDLYKTQVYQLALYRNQISPVIPQRIIDRPPTAELRANQTDQDSLPPYHILDAILKEYVEHDKSIADLIALGFTEETVKHVIALVDHNEYKRRQAPPGPKISARAFGRDRRYPITSGFKVVR